MTQVYCNAFFHFYIEIWGRIAPFLDLLLADDMPDFIIRLGCEELAGFQESFYYDLMGLDSSRVKIIGDAPVFAKEVCVAFKLFGLHGCLSLYTSHISW